MIFNRKMPRADLDGTHSMIRTREWNRRARRSCGSPLPWRWSTVMALPVTLILVACAHHPAAVRCEGRLQPINLPAPISGAAAPSPVPVAGVSLEPGRAAAAPARPTPQDRTAVDHESPKP